MANILLLEPAYRNKYPPLGLMKIAYFHKEISNDPIVLFAKGKLPYDNTMKWDRIYITTLFTFEWAEIEKTIDYAISLVEDKSKIFVGGIAATLLYDLIRKDKPGINVVKGLLNEPGKIDLENDELIDTLPPYYRILDDTEYKYPTANSYFAYTTRGCGMDCSFCAVKTLEPMYEPYIDIKGQITKIKDLHGEKKDLLLMDNNVLKSPHFAKIVNDLIMLGFGKGARIKLNGKEVQRFVDFNQGLDANLLTDEKAQLLAKLELRPVRIAFDHIQDEDVYVRAIERCVDAGLREFSNYALYNSDENIGKGKRYPPDTPKELYQRLEKNIDLQDRLNKNLSNDKVSIYSFPMRFIPLTDRARGYVGPGWNSKFLRAIQVMLTPTQGTGMSSRAFFKAAFGDTIDVFKRILVMPEYIISSRGHFVENNKDSEDTRQKRYKTWGIKQLIWKEWERLYDLLPNKQYFISSIADNIFSVEKFFSYNEIIYKKIYLHYLTIFKFLELLEKVNPNSEDYNLILNYCNSEAPVFLQKINNHIISFKTPYGRLSGYFKFFKLGGIDDYIKSIIIPSQFSTIKRSNVSIENNDNSALYNLFHAWNEVFNNISDKVNFVNIIRHEHIGLNTYHKLTNKNQKKTYLFYFSEWQLLELFKETDNIEEIKFLFDYCAIQFPLILDKLISYIYYKSKNQPINITGFVKIFGKKGVNELIDVWFNDNCENLQILNLLERAFATLRHYHYADLKTLRALHMYIMHKVFSKDDQLIINKLFSKKDYSSLNTKLANLYETFQTKFLNTPPPDSTAEQWKTMSNNLLAKFYEDTFGRLFIE